MLEEILRVMYQLTHDGQVGVELWRHGKVDSISNSKTGAHCVGKGDFHYMYSSMDLF